MEFKVEEGFRFFEKNTSTKIMLPALKISRCFKGDQEMAEDKMSRIKQGFAQRGYIKMRPFERIEFETGMSLENFNLFNVEEISIASKNDYAIKKGLVVMNTQPLDKEGKVVAVLYNSNPFLTTVTKGDFIAEMSCKETPEFSVK